MEKNIDEVIDRLDAALQGLETAQGRVFNVGTKVRYQNKFGVITHLNQGSEDPAGTTVDLRLDDGTTVDSVKVTATTLEFFKA